MYHKIEAWLNDILGQKIPSEVRAFCFNLYDDWYEGWHIELVGTENFDVDDEDWACDEITDFGTREKPLSWKKEADWNEVLSEVSSALKQYLENGLYADILKSRAGVAVGFVDGNLEILYSNLSGVTQEPPILSPGLEYDEKIARQNIEADGETLNRELGKKSINMRMVIVFIAIIVLVMFLLCVLGLINSNRNTTVSEAPSLQTDSFGEENEEFPAEVQKDSFLLSFDGFDTGVEIFFKDCVCEYDKDDICVYSYLVDDPAVEAEGYAIYIQTPEDTMEIFPVADYLVDQNAGCLYMIWGIQSFERIQGVEFVNGINSYKILGTYNMEELIAETYGLELLDYDEDFTFLQAEFTEFCEKDDKIVLRGSGSALYHASYNGLGKKYSIEWEIDTETIHKSAKAYLSDFDIHPLYAAFLRNEISVKNPFVPEGYDYNTELTYFGDRIDYEEDFWKSFSLVDVNNDGDPELIFKMYSSPSELVYILGVQNEKLVCYDIHETHTTHMAFYVYDNGIVYWGQNYDGEEGRYYTFTEDGKEHELIHFIREADSDSDLYYDYYYLEGNKEAQYSLQSYEEYESLAASYEGGEPEWFDCESFADIPQNQGISKTEIVEKNAKNTGELRISTSITKLWLNEDEEGAAEINAALREIYEAAEAEMEAYNQEILDEYLFEDGELQEDLDEWLLYPLDEWLAISTENYVAAIEYVDENYLCLSMNGDNFVAGGAHGFYWSDYYVFHRHTGQRLSLKDFVNDSGEEIKEIVKTHILAVAPYCKGEQSENALEQNRFFLTAEGLGIHYDVYEIGDYASGPIDLIIPFELFDMKEGMWPGVQ